MRDAINDLALGAGNVPFWLRDRGDDMEVPRIWLDRPWIAPDGESRTVLTLKDIIFYSGMYRRMYRELGVAVRAVVVIHFKLAIDVYLHWIALAAEGIIAAAVNPNLGVDAAKEYGRRIGAFGILFEGHASLAGRDGAAKLWWSRLAEDTQSPPEEMVIENQTSVDDGVFPYQPKDIVLLYHTSGTTGLPKAVAATHHGFMAGIRSELRQPPSPLLGTTMLNALPAAHQSSFATITRGLLSDTKLILVSNQSAKTLVDAVESHKPSCIISFSCTVRDVAKLNLPPDALKSVGLWMSTGDASRRSDVAVVSKLGSHPVANSTGIRRNQGMFVLDCFGSSELGHVHFSYLHAPGRLGEARCIGRPASFVTAKILDKDGDELPDDDVGYLAVQSDSITAGYWNDLERTASSWRNGFWITGDVAYRDRFGRYFHLDRHTDVIETGDGFAYSVRLEEEIFLAFPELSRCAVVSRKVECGNAEAVCFIEVPNEGRTKEEWHLSINAILEGASLPLIKETLLLPRGGLPVGPTGKVKKFLLRNTLDRELYV